MYLKKIEIKGFKSFANKLELDFNSGITVVVGPNGSGKSNIVDAVRWVLGEQSIKTLRGAKTEEVIFSGTENKKALGFAEVSMTLDNTAGTFNSDFSEVKITRCLYRTGDSEYKINDSICRLKDIYEVFFNTGIGKEGYSIIGQGKIDEILSSKPKERRSFFEEATGISKSRIDLNESNKKLEDERQNLLRINDIISEIEGQIEPLRAQSEKASVFIEYKNELKDFEINLFLMDIERFKEEYDDINLRYNSCKMELEEKEENLEISNEEKKELNEKLIQIRNLIEIKSNDINHFEIKCTQMNNEKSLVEQKISNTVFNITSKEELIDKHDKMIHTKNEMIDNASIDFKKVEKELDERVKVYEAENDIFVKSNDIIIKNEEELESLKQNVIDMMNNTFEIKSEIQNYENKLENLEENNDNLAKQDTTLAEEMENAEKSYADILSEKNLILEEKEELISMLNKVKSDKENIDTERQRISNEIKTIEGNLKGYKAKSDVLKSLEKSHDGYNKGVKEILDAANNKKLKGIIGTISELITVPAEYEIAVQVSMGARIQNIITDNDENSKVAIKYLKDNKCGRATFMPLTANVQIRDFDYSKLKNEEGFLGSVSDFISAKDEYSKLIKNLVKSVMVFDNITNAMNASNKYKYAYNMVTLMGEQVNSNGSLTGGEYKNQINLLSRAREIQELDEKIKKLDSELLSNIESMAKADKDFENVSAEEIEKSAQIKEKEMMQFRSEEKLNSLQKEKESLDLKIKQGEEERALFVVHKKMYKDLKEEKKEELKKVESKLEIYTGEIDRIKVTLDIEKENKSQKNEELVNMKVAISALEKEKEHHDSTLKMIRDEIKMLEFEKENNKKLVKAYKEDIEKFNLEIVNIESENIELITEKEKLKKEYDTLKIDLSVDEDKFKVIEETISKLLKGKEEVQLDLYKEENLLSNCNIKLENVRQKLLETYELTYEEAVSHKDKLANYNELRENVKAVKKKILSLGNVNIDAIEQYEECKVRYEFLKTQRDDIVDAEEKLEILTKHLLDEMRTRFTNNLADINKKFDAVFKELFEGGNAKVELVDSEDVLEAGIEIIVTPPGKKVQNLMLLSGGERALVAISLLFGILELKPSPFCILDEIEAALDEANVYRFANYIRKLSTTTQFLVITHRSGTMEVADFMYGVTMEEKGISKLVSLKLGNKEYATDNEDDKKTKGK